MSRTLLRVVFLAGGLALLPISSVYADPGLADKPDALIGTSESIDDHEAGYEDIHDHEGRREDIHNHEGASRSVTGMSVPAEELSDHHADSETLDGRVVQSERLSGMGHEVKTSSQKLDAAREALAAARARHAHHESQARPASAAIDPDAPASSSGVEARYASWTARIDVARNRIEVARANLQVRDESYADMIRNDYPRGDARQAVIDSRDQARSRVEAEEARLPRLVEAARRDGVPPGVLEIHSGQ